nr:trichohyalin-like [Pogona vitticeps]
MSFREWPITDVFYVNLSLYLDAPAYLQQVSQWEEREARLHLLEDRLSYLRLQLRNAHAELNAMKEEAEKSKRRQEMPPWTATERLALLPAQAILSEKDRELLRLRATISALEAELCDMERLQGEYKHQLERQQDEALREKEKELLQLREALECEKQQVLQEVQSTLLQERKKWEAEARAALQMQREALLEKDRRMQADLRVALEEERKTALALRDETANLHARIQELESQARLFQAEKRVAVEELREQLQKEKEQALRHLRDDLEQERVQDMERMRAKLQEAEEQQGILRAEERKSGAEWAERSLAMEVASMARQLQDLLPRKAGRLSFSQGPHRSPAVFSSGHTLRAVREICQDTQRYLQELRHEAEMQKHEILPVQKEKGCYPHLRSSCARQLNGTSFSSQGSFSTQKLLRLLQGQIRELRAEKAGYHGGSPDHLSVFREDLANTDTEAK